MVHRIEMVVNLNLLGKSSKDGNNGINEPGDINPGKAFKICFSNLQEWIKKIFRQYPL